MSSSLADEVFHCVAYKARNKKQILAGLDEFLDQVQTVHMFTTVHITGFYRSRSSRPGSGTGASG